MYDVYNMYVCLYTIYMYYVCVLLDFGMLRYLNTERWVNARWKHKKQFLTYQEIYQYNTTMRNICVCVCVCVGTSNTYTYVITEM
jgi:hypothetical protein